MSSQVLLDLPPLLRRYGINVVEMPGWKTRGSDPFNPIAILDHHDAMGLHNMNVPNNMIREGQYGSQVWVGWDGRVAMMASGNSPHAGTGSGYGVIPANAGNRTCIGIETDYKGSGDWPDDLVRSWRILRFCLAKLMGWTPGMVNARLAGHKEYAPARKPDPANFSMAQARADLVTDLTRGYPPGFAPANNPSTSTPAPATPTNNEEDMTERIVQFPNGEIWVCDYATASKWHVPTMDVVQHLKNVGLKMLDGAQAPQYYEFFTDVSYNADKIRTYVSEETAKSLRSEGVSGAADVGRFIQQFDPWVRQMVAQELGRVGLVPKA